MEKRLAYPGEVRTNSTYLLGCLCGATVDEANEMLRLGEGSLVNALFYVRMWNENKSRLTEARLSMRIADMEDFEVYHEIVIE
jgi:hypothetical protein